MYYNDDLANLSEDLELQDLGFQLPIGYWYEGKRYRYYQTAAFTGNTEILLAELEDRYSKADNKYNLLYGLFLAKHVTHLDNTNLSSFTPSASELFQDFYLADIIAMALNIRLKAQGHEIPVSCVCPCSNQYKITPKEAGYHDLGSLIIKTWQGEEPPVFRLNTSVGEIVLQPPRFKDIPRLCAQQSGLNAENRIAIACSNFTEEKFYQIPRRERRTIVELGNRIAKFSADPGLEMDCPKCGKEWTASLILGENYEDFYFSLLATPKPEEGTYRDYLNSRAQILVIGENAPLKSLQEFFELTPGDRETWTNYMAEFYKKQEEEMKRAQSK